jgi:hypothetical protein
MRTSGAIDWFLRSRDDGTIVLGQRPNARALAWMAAWSLSRVAPAGPFRRSLETAAAAILVLWALDELLRGVNPFRRSVGALAMAAVAAGALRRWSAA